MREGLGGAVGAADRAMAAGTGSLAFMWDEIYAQLVYMSRPLPEVASSRRPRMDRRGLRGARRQLDQRESSVGADHPRAAGGEGTQAPEPRQILRPRGPVVHQGRPRVVEQDVMTDQHVGDPGRTCALLHVSAGGPQL